MRRFLGHDWAAVRQLLHPYLHWTARDGSVVRGRLKVLAMLKQVDHMPAPAVVELRDGQVYRCTCRQGGPPMPSCSPRSTLDTPTGAWTRLTLARDYGSEGRGVDPLATRWRAGPDRRVRLASTTSAAGRTARVARAVTSRGSGGNDADRVSQAPAKRTVSARWMVSRRAKAD